MAFLLLFRLELLDGQKKVIASIFQGKFSNPGRNMASFAVGGISAKGIRLVIDKFYQSTVSDRLTLGLAEIQIFNSQNENLANRSNISAHGLNGMGKHNSRSWTGWFTSGATTRGAIVDLESWLSTYR